MKGTDQNHDEQDEHPENRAFANLSKSVVDISDLIGGSSGLAKEDKAGAEREQGGSLHELVELGE